MVEMPSLDLQVNRACERLSVGYQQFTGDLRRETFDIADIWTKAYRERAAISTKGGGGHLIAHLDPK